MEENKSIMPKDITSLIQDCAKKKGLELTPGQITTAIDVAKKSWGAGKKTGTWISNQIDNLVDMFF